MGHKVRLKQFDFQTLTVRTQTLASAPEREDSGNVAGPPTRTIRSVMTFRVGLGCCACIDFEHCTKNFAVKFCTAALYALLLCENSFLILEGGGFYVNGL